MEDVKNKFLSKLEFMEPNGEMDEDQGKVLLNLTMMTQANPDLDKLGLDDEADGEMLIDFKKTLGEMQGVRILVDRLKICSPGTKVTLGALGALSVFMKTPGEAVITAYYIHMKRAGEVVQSNHVCLDMFRMGFFSEEQLTEMWDMQKRSDHEKDRSDNWLDYKEFWDLEN